MSVVGLTVCRGCCCGTERKRPEIDHDRQLRRLHELAASGHARVRESDCLGPCADANVVVVRPSPAARVRGARPVWVGDLDNAATESLLAWVSAGGPGVVPIPADLRARVIPPDRR